MHQIPDVLKDADRLFQAASLPTRGRRVCRSGRVSLPACTSPISTIKRISEVIVPRRSSQHRAGNLSWRQNSSARGRGRPCRKGG